ncbi:peptidase M48 Ste24p [Cellulomonas flavigena DSM 20109]|uniref:Peptidase M48 Ste24p n=1 Tax=Cellulomonas flavigena (strain ATCC 482 / DSM 20109 / BCRC 11376 / JCM 18109 / NBRC 3775 / NCIMB 8073 / NRS 134) TaxID=446466 RepID=D5ULR6_CELFN|nr:M48 family metallopeptidase [Cellulomonas flavigena]ADG76022.1 peptidase M48 Ste24p [Cellulomonas flavigena DSM 20109]
MSTRLRALVAVVTLGGFYVAALAVVVGLGALTVLAMEAGTGVVAGKLGFVTLAAAGGLVVALWKVARARPPQPTGPVLLRADAPELWGIVDELASLTGTRGPDEIRLAPDVNAGVWEDARLLGLVGGTRRMVLGVPLLHGLTVGQLRSVLAHELGHYSHDDTRLSVVVHRGRAVIAATLAQLSGSVAGWLLRQYGKLYLLVSAATSRCQELAADALSVRAAGRATAQSALREVLVIDAAWDFYLDCYVAPGWEIGLAPTSDAFFGGFRELLAARTQELGSVRERPAGEQGSRWDSHPPIGERVVAMDRLPDVPAQPDDRPASVLVPHLDVVAAHLADEVLDVADRQRLPWDQLVPPMAAAAQQRRADAVHRAAGRLAGVQRATLGTVLELVEQGRGDDLARELGIDPRRLMVAAPGERPPHPLAGALEPVLGAALVAGGAARWCLEWAGPATLRDREGDEPDLTAWADRAARPGGVEHVRAWLAGLGVDPRAVGQVHERATAHGAQVLAGLANVAVDGTDHDVVVLDRGLVLVPCPKKTDGGKARILGVVQAVPVHQLAQVHRFVPYEEVRTATVHRQSPVHATVELHDGSRLVLKERWSGEYLVKGSQEVLVGHLHSLATTP